ncbi:MULTISPECIES: hypothetical protein [unclassified Bradyrhizobium]|uniref:hypothetical protein n=1 Tax=unclassified Bradyrhizobium TaxID=2631580 RepID=UPI0028E2F5F4|nr:MULTISPECIES: hypothetical protein [unclassified Bradyrhizobium]
MRRAASSLLAGIRAAPAGLGADPAMGMDPGVLLAFLGTEPASTYPDALTPNSVPACIIDWAIKFNRAARPQSSHDPRDGIITSPCVTASGISFARAYERHFAELPSETLRRARMDAPVGLRHNSSRH